MSNQLCKIYEVGSILEPNFYCFKIIHFSFNTWVYGLQKHEIKVLYDFMMRSLSRYIDAIASICNYCLFVKNMRWRHKAYRFIDEKEKKKKKKKEGDCKAFCVTTRKRNNETHA